MNRIANLLSNNNKFLIFGCGFSGSFFAQEIRKLGCTALLLETVKPGFFLVLSKSSFCPQLSAKGGFFSSICLLRSFLICFSYGKSNLKEKANNLRGYHIISARFQTRKCMPKYFYHHGSCRLNIPVHYRQGKLCKCNWMTFN